MTSTMVHPAEEPVKYWVRPPDDPTPVHVGRGTHRVHLVLTDTAARQLAGLLVRNQDGLDGWAVRVGIDVLTAEAAPPVLVTDTLTRHAGVTAGVLRPLTPSDVVDVVPGEEDPS